jgi:hypothetical protein
MYFDLLNITCGWYRLSFYQEVFLNTVRLWGGRGGSKPQRVCSSKQPIDFHRSPLNWLYFGNWWLNWVYFAIYWLNWLYFRVWSLNWQYFVIWWLNWLNFGKFKSIHNSIWWYVCWGLVIALSSFSRACSVLTECSVNISKLSCSPGPFLDVTNSTLNPDTDKHLPTILALPL